MELDIKYLCDKCNKRRRFKVIDKLEKCASQRFGNQFKLEYFYVVKCIKCNWKWWV